MAQEQAKENIPLKTDNDHRIQKSGHSIKRDIEEVTSDTQTQDKHKKAKTQRLTSDQLAWLSLGTSKKQYNAQATPPPPDTNMELYTIKEMEEGTQAKEDDMFEMEDITDILVKYGFEL